MKLRLDPNEKQKQFFTDRHRYIAFGGARGGGKSWAVRVKAVLLALRYDGCRVLIIRRTYPELRANHIEPMRQWLGTAAKYCEKNKEFLLGRSVIRFGYCACDRDLLQYQGQEVDFLFVDEATQLTEHQFSVLQTCVRGVNPFPKRVYVTCNPGGVGMAWVKRLFVDRRYRDAEDENDYSFIRSLVTDNHALMKADPDYVRGLDALPEKLKRAWRFGEWDCYDGQFFEEFRDDPSHYADRRFTHVIDPFDIPSSWPVLRSFDFGYARPFSCGWWTVDPDGRLYRIAELYGCTKEPNTGVKWEPNRIFEEIRNVESQHPYLAGRTISGVADPSIWDASRGQSVAETAALHGIYFAKADNRRLAGWMQVHYRLAFDEQGIPMMYVFSDCKAFRRTIPLLQYDEVQPEDLDTSAEDHVADEVRYLCMSRPIRPVLPPAEPVRGDDPLDLNPRRPVRYDDIFG